MARKPPSTFSRYILYWRTHHLLLTFLCLHLCLVPHSENKGYTSNPRHFLSNNYCFNETFYSLWYHYNTLHYHIINHYDIRIFASPWPFAPPKWPKWTFIQKSQKRYIKALHITFMNKLINYTHVSFWYVLTISLYWSVTVQSQSK